MALFKIFGNFASGNIVLPSTTTQGYCYFDKNTGKFYIDTATSDTAALGINRLALNAKTADEAKEIKLQSEINPIDTNEDLNSYTTIGRYYIPYLISPTNNQVTNLPITLNDILDDKSSGDLLVVQNNSFLCQFLILNRYSVMGRQQNLFLRIRTGVNWSNWKELTNEELDLNASDVTYDSSTAPEDIQAQLEQDDETLSNVEDAINYIFNLFINSNESLQYLLDNAHCFGDNGLQQAELEADPISDYEIATKHYVDQAFQANDAMIFKGTLGTGGTVTALPAEHYQGWTYRVITAGQYAGKQCEIGDMIICITDGTAANNDHWTVVQTNIDGAVTGPASATANAIATFNGTTGKVIQNSAKTLTTTAPTSSATDSTIPTSKAVWSAISNNSVSDITYATTDGSIAKVAGNTTTKVAADVPGYDPATETTTTLVNNVTVSGFYLDDNSDGNYGTQLYRSADNALTGFTTEEDFSKDTRYLVTWDGTEYECYSFIAYNHPTHNAKLGDMTTVTSAWTTTLLGNALLLKFATVEDNSSLPFVITYKYVRNANNVIIWTRSTATSHTITIKKISRNYKKLAVEEIPYFYFHPEDGLSFKAGSGYRGLVLNQGIDAAGRLSIAGGAGTYATGDYSTAFGFGNLASGENSATIGAMLSQATGKLAIATGQQTKATGISSTAFGALTTASGQASIAAGFRTVASDYGAVALGNRSVAAGAYSLVIGTDNIEDTNIVDGQTKRKYIFIAGNGTSASAKSNAATIDWQGNLNAQTSLGVADAVQMVYNSTTQALDFVFA